MSKKSLSRGGIVTAAVLAINATLVLITQPFASTAPRGDRAGHVFVPTTVAIESRDETPAPTF